MGDLYQSNTHKGKNGDGQNGLGETLATLLRQCASGDQAAFRRLYDQQSARLYGIAMRITRQPSLAADAVHDAFLQVWQNAGRFDGNRGQPEAWLASLARYRALDLVRRHGRETLGAEVDDQEDNAPDALAQMITASDAQALSGCLGRLDADKRRVITLAFVDGYSHHDLTERLHLPLGTVKSWIRRGLLSLKKCLES